MRLVLETAPVEYPVALNALKQHLRIELDDTSEDLYLDGLIDAATAHAEGITGRRFVEQEWSQYFDAFPCTDAFELANPKLQTVTFIKYVDANGTLQTLASNQYVVDAKGIVGQILIAPTVSSWPITQTRNIDAVQVKFVCGYGEADDVPKGIKQAIMIMAATWYAHRETVIAGVTIAKVPDSASALLDQFWVARL